MVLRDFTHLKHEHIYIFFCLRRICRPVWKILSVVENV
jgi:hypothetical protein